nr:hypothetical protein [Tanacetum cinerariifolium]
VNNAHGVSAASSKNNASNLPNVDSLSDAVIYSFFSRRNLGVKGTETIRFDKTKEECYNCHIRDYFAKKCRASKHQDNRNTEAPRRTVPAEDGPTNSVLMAYTSSSSSSSLNSDTEVNDKYNSGEGYHAVPPPYTENFMPPKHNLVFADEHVVSEYVTSPHDIAKNEVKISETKVKNVSAPIIED